MTIGNEPVQGVRGLFAKQRAAGKLYAAGAASFRFTFSGEFPQL